MTMLTEEKFESLVMVGNTSEFDRPVVIPAAHAATLIELGYIVDLAGKLRMTTPGRMRLRQGQSTTRPALRT
jgi:hypothetical protein